jgi:hypothetical protein
MTLSPTCRIGLPLALAALLLAARTSSAQMVPLTDVRWLDARAEYQGAVDGQYFHIPSAPFAPFNELLEAYVDGSVEGSASADAYQNSQFYPSAIYASGTTSGQWQTVGPGNYAAHAVSGFEFRVDTCVTWSLYVQVDPGDTGTSGSVALRIAETPFKYLEQLSGAQTLTGRLSPGRYYLEGRSTTVSSAPSLQGPTYSMIFQTQVCSTPLIVRQVRDTTIACGPTLALSVIAATPSGTSYQWRRNLAPLANSGHVSGVTTATLSIASACAADTGYYDVVLTNGGIVEPSHAAHVTLTGTSGVAPSPPPGSGLLALAAPSPNPSTGTTSFRFSAGRPLMATAAIYDAAGRLVRPLESRMIAGSGAFTWDGRAASGATVPAGIYFLRVRAEGVSEVRRFVRLDQGRTP